MTIPREPTTHMLRALIKHRGYDPDAKEETLDTIEQLEVAIMGAYIEIWKVMYDAAIEEMTKNESEIKKDLPS